MLSKLWKALFSFKDKSAHWICANCGLQDGPQTQTWPRGWGWIEGYWPEDDQLFCPTCYATLCGASQA